MADLETFRTETRAWLESNCPESIIHIRISAGQIDNQLWPGGQERDHAAVDSAAESQDRGLEAALAGVVSQAHDQGVEDFAAFLAFAFFFFRRQVAEANRSFVFFESGQPRA